MTPTRAFCVLIPSTTRPTRFFPVSVDAIRRGFAPAGGISNAVDAFGREEAYQEGDHAEAEASVGRHSEFGPEARSARGEGHSDGERRPRGPEAQGVEDSWWWRLSSEKQAGLIFLSFITILVIICVIGTFA